MIIKSNQDRWEISWIFKYVIRETEQLSCFCSKTDILWVVTFFHKISTVFVQHLAVAPSFPTPSST